MSYREFRTTFAGRELVVETGKMCALSNGSCLVRYGETVVLANITMSAKVSPPNGTDSSRYPTNMMKIPHVTIRPKPNLSASHPPTIGKK